jgi:glycosyltransferase involved in cell wall biosynthesis
MHARRESQALADQGYDVDVICLRRPDETRSGRDGAIRFTRLSIPKSRGSLARYGLSYGSWFALCSLLLTFRQLRRRYASIQITSLPDHQVFAAAIPKLLGAKVVLFLKEPTSELFSTLFGSERLTRTIAKIEMWSIGFADLTFTVTEQHRQTYVDRGADADRLRVVVNCTPTSALNPPGRKSIHDNDGGPIRVIYPGTIEPRWGHDCILRAFAKAVEEVPELRLVITGEGTHVDEMLALIDELKLAEVVSYEGWVCLERLQELFSQADIGISAQQASTYSHLVHTGKMYEYMMFGIPCISSRLDATVAYFGEDIITYFEPDDSDDLARAIIKLAMDPERRRIQSEEASKAFAPYHWDVQSQIYLGALDALLEP